MARRYLVMSLAADSQSVSLAMVDPTDVVAIDDIEFATGRRVEPLVASERAITEAMGRCYGDEQEAQMRQMMEDIEAEIRGPGELHIVEEEDIDLESLSQAGGDAPVIKLVNLLLTDALRRDASDIHIEPYEKIQRVRYRIDGVLYEVMRPPKSMQGAIASRIKIMSELDISERRRPQDGRIKIRVKLDDRTRELDLRVSTVPTIWGEKIVMRLLDPEGLKLNLADLGFEKSSLDAFRAAIELPFGIVLVTGPTGDDILDECRIMLYDSFMDSKRPSFPVTCERSSTTRSTSFMIRFPNRRSIMLWSVSSGRGRRFRTFLGV